MRVVAVEPKPRLDSILPDFTFADAYRVFVAAPGLDAGTASKKLFDHPPAWVTALMSVRNLAVGLLGLKTVGLSGGFPILMESPKEVVMGLNDRHLDFRILVSVEAADSRRQQVTVTTIVRTKTAFGRLYLASVMPFHRVISRKMLSRANYGAAG